MRAVLRFLTLSALALATAMSATSCSRLEDALAPGTDGADKVPAHVALQARVPSLSRGTIAAPQLRVFAFYERVDGTRITLATLTIPLTDAATQAVPVSIELAPCLADTQRKGASADGKGGCPVGLEITLLDGERVLDQQSLGTLVLTPGATQSVPEPVALFEVSELQLGGIAGASGGPTRLEVGRTLPLTAAVVSTTGQQVAGRAIDWSSSAPSIARVDPTTGLVTALAPGDARITASYGGHSVSVDLTVVPPPSLFTVVLLGTTGGTGAVSSSPEGINCQVANGQTTGTCAASFPGDAHVTLTATTSGSSVFGGWGGACQGVDAATSCVLTADQARTVVAGFTPMRRLAVSGTSTDLATSAGRITSAPAGIDCAIGGNAGSAGGVCGTAFTDGTIVTLTAAPSGAQTFLGWSGDCAGATGTSCTIVMTGGDHAASARFGAPVGLSVTPTGTGGGSVTYAGGGVSGACAISGNGASGGAPPTGPCSTQVPFGSLVTLTATPDPASTFNGWTGACSGTGPCTVTTDQARAVGAVFTRKQVTLTLALSGAGAGAVSAAGQTCTLRVAQGSTSCAARVDVGTPVSVAAAPGTGASFTGWSGACSGTVACTVTPQTDVTVGAAFTPVPMPVDVQVQPGMTGSGTVTSAPSGIACALVTTNNTPSAAGQCGGAFAVGSRVTLTASPSSVAKFTGWGGACSGTASTCTFTITAPPTPTNTPASTSVTARFDLLQAPIQVAGAGTGAGAVTSAPAGIDCRVDAATPASGSTCATDFNATTAVTLTASPNAGSTFAGWSGACSGAATTCTITKSTAAQPVTATFTRTLYTLGVSAVGTGGGTVGSSPSGVNCPTTCSASFGSGTSVTLTAAPNATSTFAGWSGACAGTASTCTVSVDAAKSVAATFNTITYTLSAATTGTGTGAVTASVGGINCGAACAASYPVGTTVTLTAAAGASSAFGGWSGACTGTTPTCTVTMDAAKSVTASFSVIIPTYALGVSTAGTGGGVVTSSPAGINCAAACASSYSSGTAVTLTATSNATSTFTGWTGACSGTGPCTVTMDAAKNVTATFTLVTYTVGVTTHGTGGGAVTGSGINCPTTCGATYPVGTTITLTAAPNATSTFAGWGGACAGTSTTCAVSVDAAKSVTATFNTITYPLSVSTTGAGTVTASAGGINCGSTCSASYATGSTVTLTATPGATSTFAGWGGACSGTSTTCTVTTDAAKSVTAAFAPQTYALGVTTKGTGDGVVTSSPAGINCGTTCSATYTVGTAVTLTAAPDATSTFNGWSGGGCSGTSTCAVTMTAATSVIATFNKRTSPPAPQQTLTVNVVRGDVGMGTVTSSPAGIACTVTSTTPTVTCSASFPTGTVVTLTATPATNPGHVLWNARQVSCPAVGPCSNIVTMSAAQTVSIRFP